MNKNAKKASFIVGGVVATLVAASPLAFAGDWGHGHGHGKGGPEKVCAFQGGDGGAASGIDGNALANIVAQVPVAGNNIANIGNCSEFLNNNLNNNLSGNNVDVL